MMWEKQIKSVLNNILNFVTNNSHTKVILTTVFYKCELFDWCCVSNEVHCCRI